MKNSPFFDIKLDPLMKMLDFTGSVRCDKPQTVKVQMAYQVPNEDPSARRRINVDLTYPEIGLLMIGLAEAVTVQQDAPPTTRAEQRAVQEAPAKKFGVTLTKRTSKTKRRLVNAIVDAMTDGRSTIKV
jgi:hypothetical protein